MVIVACKKCNGGHAFARCFAFPSHVGASCFVFAPGKCIDAFARVTAVVIFKKTARRICVQIGIDQRSSQPTGGTEFVITTECERVFRASTVLLPVGVITL